MELLNEIADSIYSYNALGCLKYKLVDDLIYEDQLDSIIRKNLGIEEKDPINKISFKKYLSKSTTNNSLQFGSGVAKKKGNIAIIYAVGDIISGESNNKYGFINNS